MKPGWGWVVVRRWVVQRVGWELGCGGGGGMLVGGDILILKSFWYKEKLKEVQKLAKTSGAFAIVVVSDLGGAPGLCRTRPGCDDNLQ